MVTLLRFNYRTAMQIGGKVVLITGASSGIGAACASKFRKRGARLALTARSAERLEEVAGPDDLVVAGDITAGETRCRVVKQVLGRFGTIDVLVNNAGAGLYAPSWDTPPEMLRGLFELNFFAPLEMIRLVVPHMRERRSGVVVNVTSIAAKVTLPWLPLYSASKSALGSVTAALRMELEADGIRAMEVCPGYVITRFRDSALTGKPPRGVEESGAFRITADQCAEAIAKGLERDARTVVAPRVGWLFAAAARVFPSVVDSRMARMLREAERPQ